MPEVDCVLTNVEFIALKMATHPGQSGRFYRRACQAYKHPKLFKTLENVGKSTSDHYAFYFRRNSRYRGKLWVDGAQRTVRDHMPFLKIETALKPKKSSWHLTSEGQRVADRAFRKLGLPAMFDNDVEIPFAS